LAICKKISEAMEGCMTIKSRVNVGSKFSFYFRIPNDNIRTI